MKLFVLGNINAGKSYYVEKLKRKLPEYPVLSIDDYRKKYGDGTIEKEELTRQLFANDIVKTPNAIIEFSGGSTITDLFIKKLRKNSVLILEIKTDVSICLERLESKDFSKTPYPRYSEKLEDTISRLDKDFTNNLVVNNFFDKYIRKFDIYNAQDFDLLPLKQYELALDLADAMKDNYDTLFAFGSFANETLSQYSDVDLFLKTSNSISKVKNDLLTIFPFAKHIYQKNQIAIYIDSYLIEINIISSLNEAKLFYNTCNVKRPNKSILLGYEGLESDLQYLLDTYYDDFKIKFMYTLSRFDYYVESLFRLAKKQDCYKYYFHNNIVIHEYVRLTYFMEGERDYDYLPKNVYKYLSKEEWNTLLFSFDKDITSHSNEIRSIAQLLIKRAKTYLESL